MATNESSDWKERKCGALWKNKTKTEVVYYQGKIELDGKEYPIQIFKNKWKEDGDNRPDLQIYIDKK